MGVPWDNPGGRAVSCVRLLLCALLTSCAADTSDRDNLDQLPRLQFVEDLRIGSVDDPDVGFSRLGLAAVDRDGNVFVLEGLDLQIRMYDPAGRLLRRIGRRGGGPGEFDGWPHFGVKGDALWTYDMESGPITLFDRTGHTGSPQRWIVLDQAGRPRGDAELPENAQVLWCGSDVVWAAVPDELDVPWLVRYRLSR